MNIKETFLKLTKKTYPHGNEYRLRWALPKGTQKDKHGNYFYKIGESKTIFASHLDTVSEKFLDVKHVFDGKFIKTNGKTTLGADDKAGVCVLLYMIEQNIPGTYYFFIGEEVGCIGSRAAAAKDDFSNYDRIISFDRKDTCSIITHQSWERCCSDEFANALSKEYYDLGLELKPDDTGFGTDSARFTGIIPECTNISVGYYDEHNFTERQDIEFLEKICMASAIVDWEKLPVTRNPRIPEYKDYEPNYSLWGRHIDFERGRRWNDNRKPWEKSNRYPIPIGPNQFGDPAFDEELLRDTYGYYEEPIDVASRLDLKNRKKRTDEEYADAYIREQTDVFTCYKDYLADTHFSIKDYGIIEEQFIEFW